MYILTETQVLYNKRYVTLEDTEKNISKILEEKDLAPLFQRGIEIENYTLEGYIQRWKTICIIK